MKYGNQQKVKLEENLGKKDESQGWKDKKNMLSLEIQHLELEFWRKNFL